MRKRCGESGIGAVRKTRAPRRIKGTTSRSSKGNMAWLAIWVATRLRRQGNETARQRMVVVPMRGLMPMRRPAAMLQARVLGVAPMRRRARMGRTARR
jgi:hypothetical protein